MYEWMRLKQEQRDLMFIDRAVAQCNEREARQWSAAWKASAKFNRDKLLIELDRVKRLIAEWHKQQDRAIAAEKRVAELEATIQKKTQNNMVFMCRIQSHEDSLNEALNK